MSACGSFPDRPSPVGDRPRRDAIPLWQWLRHLLGPPRPPLHSRLFGILCGRTWPRPSPRRGPEAYASIPPAPLPYPHKERKRLIQNVMRQIKKNLMLFCIMASISLTSCSALKEYCHFFDSAGNSLEKYEPAWEELHKFYGNAMPGRITIYYREGSSSFFHVESNSIEISLKHLAEEPVRVVAHEASHVCLGHLTRGASGLERFRFFDEGFANIMGAILSGTLDQYKKQALVIAKRKYLNGDVSFEKAQEWSKYFGGPEEADYDAYLVGSSFVFYIIDTFGIDKLYDFFVDVGRTRNLEQSLTSVAAQPLQEVEKQWLRYINSTPAAPTAAAHIPTITAQYPENGSSHVPIDTEAIYVEFDVPMARSICVSAKCDEGICYDNAFWESEKRLKIAVVPRLLPNHPYKLSLGVPGKCSLKSRAGVELPIVTWVFKTEP